MKGQEKSVDEIADIITEAVFADGIVRRDEVKAKIAALIRGFVKSQNRPSNAIVDATTLKEGERANYVNTIAQDKKEKQFWKTELAKAIGEEKMRALYDKLSIELLKDKFKPV